MREIIDWFTSNLPPGLYAEVPTITVDREEILVVGPIPGDPHEFRERTRRERIAVARRAEEIFGRKVAWGVQQDGERTVFTNVAVPVMTRLRQPERAVLDTLIAAGLARSRADALAWCVRLVGQHEGDWIARMQKAVQAVHEARDSGPAARVDEPSAADGG